MQQDESNLSRSQLQYFPKEPRLTQLNKPNKSSEYTLENQVIFSLNFYIDPCTCPQVLIQLEPHV